MLSAVRAASNRRLPCPRKSTKLPMTKRLRRAILLVAARFPYRFLLLEIRRVRSSDGSHNVMVIGAGGAGQTIIRSIVRNRLSGDKVVCIIDDNPNKWNRYIDGIPIVGGRDDIMYFVEKYDIDKIYIAIPSASKENKRDILNICSETNCVLKNLPDFYQYANTDINIGSLRDVSVEDLLGREPLRTDMSDVFEMIKGKTILVTSGGGSIGSELCRQIAAHQPERLIIFDIYENNAYAIQQELREKYPEMELTFSVISGGLEITGLLFKVQLLSFDLTRTIEVNLGSSLGVLSGKVLFLQRQVVLLGLQINNRFIWELKGELLWA